MRMERIWAMPNKLTFAIKPIAQLLMVAGALGSFVVNIVSKGDWATSLQWLGAYLLYTALTIRNVR